MCKAGIKFVLCERYFVLIKVSSRKREKMEVQTVAIQVYFQFEHTFF
jgi:hypothetical protein